MASEQPHPVHDAEATASQHAPSPAAALSCTQCRSRKLRCDRQRPVCGRCLAQGQECHYPASRHHTIGRRKTVRELEERIEQLEDLLKAASLSPTQDTATQQPAQGVPDTQPQISQPFNLSAVEIDWSNPDAFGGVDLPSYQDLSFEPFQSWSTATANVSDTTKSPENQLIDLGLFERLPSPQLVDELTNFFFQNVAAGAPMLHKVNYTISRGLPPHMSPPMCLQYIIMASGAATSPAHRHLADALYQRARIYAEADELKGPGQTYATVGHVQSWLLISAYECHVHAVFTRASTSLCRALRIAQMLNLHRLDSPSTDILLSSLPPARNFIEAEERRRTWWVVFLGDRFLTATTGWPSLVDEKLIRTNLPSTEEAYTTGRGPPSPFTLSDGLVELQKKRDSQLSSLSVRIIAANELLHTLDHTLNDLSGAEKPDEHFWRRHNEISRNLGIIGAFTNENMLLRPGAVGLDPILVHACTNMANMQLHRLVVGLTDRRMLPSHLVAHSQASLRNAAEETLKMFHAAGNGLAGAIRNPAMCFAAYMASMVFLDDLQEAESLDRRNSEDGFLFLARTLKYFGEKVPLVRAMSSQLDAGMREAGYDPSILNEFGDEAQETTQMLKSSSKQLPMVFCPALTVAFNSTSEEVATAL